MFGRKTNEVFIFYCLLFLVSINFANAQSSLTHSTKTKNKINEPSRLNTRLQRHVNIPQVCKKELKEYCPKSLYPTRQDRFQCLSKKIDIFSSNCQYYVVRSKNFYEKCSTDIAVLCNNSGNGANNMSVYEKNCSETLIKQYKRLSTECAHYIIGYTGNNISTKTVVHDIMRGRSVEEVASNAVYRQKQRKLTSKNNKQRVLNEDIVNDGNYTAEDIKNMKLKVVLTNGIITNQYETSQFEKKYNDILKDMNEQERNQFQNKYFEMKYGKK